MAEDNTKIKYSRNIIVSSEKNLVITIILAIVTNIRHGQISKWPYLNGQFLVLYYF